MTSISRNALTIISTAVQDRHGFLTRPGVTILADEAPHQPVLLRFGAHRCVVPASAVEATIDCMAIAGDYLRDASIPVDQDGRFRLA